jgi:hypothetical protein
MRARLSAVWAVATNLLLLPSRLVEESIHAAAAIPWADEIVVRLDPRADDAETLIRYRDGTPRWAVSVAHVAPELVGWCSGVTVIAWWTIGGPVWLPATTLDWVLLWALGAQWLGLALPEQGAVGGGWS